MISHKSKAMYGFFRQLRNRVGFTAVTRGAFFVVALTVAIAQGDRANGDKGGRL